MSINSLQFFKKELIRNLTAYLHYVTPAVWSMADFKLAHLQGELADLYCPQVVFLGKWINVHLFV